ncbi:MAG TPA: thioesterase family protein [Polyangiaceae bacterium]
MYRFERQALTELTPGAFVERRTVRFQEVDAAGIVFFATFFTYFHDAYAGFLEATDRPLSRALTHSEWAAPLRHAEADYFRPLRYADIIDIAVVRVHVEASEVTVGYRVARGNEVVAVGQTVHVFVDPATFSRSAVPQELLAAFARLSS